jgi:hypothetical protein
VPNYAKEILINEFIAYFQISGSLRERADQTSTTAKFKQEICIGFSEEI